MGSRSSFTVMPFASDAATRIFDANIRSRQSTSTGAALGAGSASDIRIRIAARRDDSRVRIKWRAHDPSGAVLSSRRLDQTLKRFQHVDELELGLVKDARDAELLGALQVVR